MADDYNQNAEIVRNTTRRRTSPEWSDDENRQRGGEASQSRLRFEKWAAGRMERIRSVVRGYVG